MSHSLVPWCTDPRLFASFFQENLSALKTFCALLLSVPESQILSCTLRSPAFPPRSYPGLRSAPASLSVNLSLSRGQTFHLDFSFASRSTLSAVFSAPPHSASTFPASPHSASTFSASPHFASTLSLLPSSAPLLPSRAFLQILLILPPLQIPDLALYAEYPRPSAPSTLRFLNLSMLLAPSPPRMLHVPLYEFSRLLLVRHTRELSSLIQRFPWLSSTGRFLEAYLQEREFSALFGEKKNTLGFHPEGIQAMCSLNRLLLRENRLTELSEGSRDPAVLARLFEEYHQRGFL